MRTVQEYFKEADVEKLINLYLYTHPVDLHELSVEGVEDTLLKDAQEKVK